MSRVDQLELRYLHRALAADGDTPATLTASSGTTTTTVCAALTEADDYWNGAIARWTSGDNAGLWSRVRDFAAGSDTLTFEDELPHAVGNGDQFVLLLGGKHAIDLRVQGLRTSPLVNVSGFTIAHAAALNGEGTGVLTFDEGDGTLTWQPPRAGEAGAEVDVSGLAENDTVTLFGPGTTVEQSSKFLQLTRNPDALPGEDATDDLSLDLVSGSFLGRVPGEQAAAGSTTYWPVAVRNTSAEFVYAARAYCSEPFPGAATALLAADLGTGAGTLEADDLIAWGASGWVLNVTKGDARYYYDRSGNSATIADPGAGVRGFTSVAWDEDDELVPLPWIDIGLDAPGVSNLFEDPATRATAPSGVVFSCPRTAEEGLAIGDLAAGGVHVVWLRLEIPAGARPLEGGRTDLRIAAQFTEEG